ncbi:MAG: ATP-binding protein [Campylobacteraceae bacterium]|jgi:predicted AAA+ superfamily ATPase|nr:ATP-binding protein [Campylobacteraceae bacterium]
MDILEILYDNPPKTRGILPRKYEITAKKTALYGPRFSGKSSIIIDYLGKFSRKEMLYIDFSDMRVEADKIKQLQNFIEKNGIKIVVLEHFDFQCSVPNAEEVILSSVKKLNIDGFAELFVPLLDFEEFVSFNFDKKHQNIEGIFALFEKNGAYPQAAFGGMDAKQMQMLLQIYAQKILQNIAPLQAQTLSVHKLYKLLKPNIKLSKDTIYAKIAQFENEHLIYFLSKFDKAGADKKLYFADFALKNMLSFEKDFILKFQNIVFCELIKKAEQIFYTNMLDFYLPKRSLAIICTPFLQPELINRRFKKLSKELKSLDITSLQAITLGSEGKYKDGGLTCELIPFWEWAMR